MHLRLATAAAILLSCLATALPARAADPLRVGTASQSILWVPLDIGISIGAYAKEGLDVRKLDFSGAAKLNQAIIASAVDVGLTGSTDFSFQVKGTPAKTVGAVVDTASDFGMSVGTGINSPTDLKGKRIGVTQAGTLTYWMAQEFARHQGWGEDAIVTVPVGAQVANQIAALVTGQVAGVMAHVEIGLTLQSQNRGRVLENADSFIPNFMAASIIAADRVIRDRPDDLRRFLKAWYETVGYMNTHSEEVVKAGMAMTGTSKQVVAAEWEAEKGTWSRSGRISPQQLQKISEAITRIGLVNTKPDLTEYYDPQFLPGQPPAAK